MKKLRSGILVALLALATIVVFSDNELGFLHARDIGIPHKIADNNSLDQPAKMEAGRNYPRRVFLNQAALDVPFNFSWNFIPKKPTDALQNWLYYGSVGDEAEHFVVGVFFEGQTPLRYSGLRTSVAGRKIFTKKKIELKFQGSAERIDTRFGPVNVVLFGYQHHGIVKVCLGYGSLPSSIKLKGIYCARDARALSPATLKCLIDSLIIYDEAYWRDPKKVEQKPTTCSPSKNRKNSI